MLVAVIGQGHVGLPLSMAVASAGHTVFAVESDRSRLDRLRRGESYLADVSSMELLAAIRADRFHPVEDLRPVPPADVYLVAVPTPSGPEHQPDLSMMDRAVVAIAGSARPGSLVAVESTLYPGALRHHVRPLLDRLSAPAGLHLAYSPQRIDPGRVLDYRGVPKLLAGLDEAATAAGREFYETVFKHVVLVSSAEVAEFAKLLENTFRYVNIALVNELARTAHLMDIDFRDVVAAAGSKPYGYLPFGHGPGVGGHCLPNNVWYLRHALIAAGGSSSLLAAAVEINESAPEYTVRRLEAALARHGKSLAGARILLVGLAYKPNVSDTRESPTYAISQALVARGGRVRVADPVADPDATRESFSRVDLSAAECADADAVLLLTDHETIDYDTILHSSRFVLDCRGRLSGPEVERL